MKKALLIGSGIAVCFIAGAIIGTTAYLERLVYEYESDEFDQNRWLYLYKGTGHIYEVHVECIGD